MRKSYSGAFKARLVLEVLKENKAFVGMNIKPMKDIHALSCSSKFKVNDCLDGLAGGNVG